jgi:hypothetical protein
VVPFLGGGSGAIGQIQAVERVTADEPDELRNYSEAPKDRSLLDDLARD